MFLENDLARPLFDFEKGGPPKAYECLCIIDYKNEKLHKILGLSGKHACGKITRTERGMRMHLKTVHHWQEQPCLYSTDSQNNQSSGKPRKLRIFTKENIAATTKRSLMTVTESDRVPPAGPQPPKEPERNDQKLLELTREEK